MLDLREMLQSDIGDCCWLIEKSMNAESAIWAKKTMDFHFKSSSHGLDDGRCFFIYKNDEQFIGVIGLHHYQWGPEDNVWLSWFAVDPDNQGRGVGRELLMSVEKQAQSLGFVTLFVETYDHPDFMKAVRFYQNNGFVKAGEIAGYLSNEDNMLVFKKMLGERKPKNI